MTSFMDDPKMRGKSAKNRTSQRTNKPKGKHARGQISQGVKEPEGE